MSGSRIAVAMSGGADSTAAAVLLQEQGHDLIGLTLRTFPCDPTDPESGTDSCCGDEDLVSARTAAGALSFPHYILEGADVFEREVVSHSRREYSLGRTPNPCARCNPKIRFGHMLGRALHLGATHLATGHHARVLQGETGWELWQGADDRKDQSYFLAFLDQHMLAHALFPVGELLKTDAREMLRRKGLPHHSRPDSQDLCFAYQRNTWQGPSCRIVDRDGEVLAQGGPLCQYTVGQRKGLGIGGADAKLYVTAIDAARCTVTVGSREDLMRKSFTADSLNWVSGEEPAETLTCRVKIRHQHNPVRAQVEILENRRASVTFHEAQSAVTPGQVAAFYNGQRLLGAGIIEG